MAKIYFITQGCSANYSDTEVMQGILKEHGYKITNKLAEADIIIINTCTVKDPTETYFFNLLKTLPKKPTIIAGCIPQTDPEKLKGYSLIGTYQINNIAYVVEETLKGNIVALLKKEKNPRLNLPKIRRNPIIEILPINSGCLGNCTFCKTKAARGSLYSYDESAIIKQAKDALKQGIKEIWITSQDTGAYGKDINKTLPQLLNKILKLKGEFYIRLGMANPDQIITYLDELIAVFKHKKMFKFLHIPVQSGNDEILRKMRRNYTIKEFKNIIKKFRKQIHGLTISTDIICGFPEETEQQFNDSLKLMQQIKPDVLNISRYSPRPKTPAAKMKQFPSRIIKERSRALTKLFKKNSFNNNKKWIGWYGDVIVDEFGKNSTFVGRNYAYKPVILKGKYKLGDLVKVKIKNTAVHDLRSF